MLEAAGIRTYFRNEYVSTTLVVMPETTPALCILDPADLDQAVEIIRNYIKVVKEVEVMETLCTACGESCPDTFTVCWNCESQL
jgi:hypothetical protein